MTAVLEISSDSSEQSISGSSKWQIVHIFHHVKKSLQVLPEKKRLSSSLQMMMMSIRIMMTMVHPRKRSSRIMLTLFYLQVHRLLRKLPLRRNPSCFRCKNSYINSPLFSWRYLLDISVHFFAHSGLYFLHGTQPIWMTVQVDNRIESWHFFLAHLTLFCRTGERLSRYAMTPRHEHFLCARLLQLHGVLKMIWQEVVKECSSVR